MNEQLEDKKMDMTIYTLREQFNFSLRELEELNEVQEGPVRNLATCIYRNCFEIKLSDSLAVSFNSKLIFKFYNYEDIIITGFDKYKNYYFLPEAPKEIYILYNEVIYEVADYEYNKCQKLPYVSNSRYYTALINCLKETQESSKVFKLLLFCYSRLILNENLNYINNQNEVVINYLINHKNVFKVDEYSELINSIKLDYRIEDSTRNLLDKELKALNEENNLALDIHEHKKISEACESLYRAKLSGINIPIEKYLDIIKRANDEKYYDTRLGELCEDFVCSKAIVIEYIFDYLKFCYLKHKLKTRYTGEAVKRMAFYYRGDEQDQRIFLRSYIDEGIVNKEFIELFKVYIKTKHIDNRVVEDCIRLILRNNSIDEEIYNIILEFYKRNPKDYSILEELIYRRLQKGKNVGYDEYELLYRFYKDTNVINRKRLTIALRAVRMGVLDYLNLVFNYMKYEIINYDRSSQAEILYCGEEGYKQGVYFKSRRFRNNTYLLELGYSRYYYILNEDNTVSCYERREVNKNLKLFIDYYSAKWSQEQKDFAASICVEQNIYNDIILQDQIDGKGKYEMRALEMMIKKTAITDPETASELLREYCLRFKDRLEETQIENLLLNLSSQDIKSAVDLVSYMDETITGINYGNTYKLVINKAVKEFYYDNLNYLIYKVVHDIGKDNRLTVDTLSYINNVQINSYSRNILELFAEIYAVETFGGVIKLAIENRIIRTVVGYKDLDIVYRIYNVNNAEAMRKFLVEKSINNLEGNSEEINKLIIESYINQPHMILQYLSHMKVTKEIASFMYKVLEEDSKNYPLKFKHLEILRLISPHNEAAEAAYGKLKDIMNTIHIYYINESYDSDFGTLYKANNIYTKQQISLMSIEDEKLLNIVQIYNNNNSIKENFLVEVDEYYLLQGDSLHLHCKQYGDLKEALKIISSLLGLQVLLKSEGYILPYIELKDIIMINNVPFPKTILDIYEYEEYVRYEGVIKYPISKKSQTKKNAAYIDLYERDIVEVLRYFALEIIGISNAKTDGTDNYLEVLKKDEFNTLEELKILIDKLLYLSVNKEAERSLLFSDLDSFDIQDESSKKKIVNYIIEDDRGSEKPFNIVLENYQYASDITKAIYFLVNNFKGDFTSTDSRETAKKIMNIIREQYSSINSEDRRFRALLSRFIERAKEEKLFKSSKSFDTISF